MDADMCCDATSNVCVCVCAATRFRLFLLWVANVKRLVVFVYESGTKAEGTYVHSFRKIRGMTETFKEQA